MRSIAYPVNRLRLSSHDWSMLRLITDAGDLRFAHARVREYSESITFYDGQRQEKYGWSGQ